MSGIAHDAVLYHSKAVGKAERLLRIMAGRAAEGLVIDPAPGYIKLAEIMNVTERYIGKLFRQLSQLGEIERIRRGTKGSASAYRITLPTTTPFARHLTSNRGATTVPLEVPIEVKPVPIDRQQEQSQQEQSQQEQGQQEQNLSNSSANAMIVPVETGQQEQRKASIGTNDDILFLLTAIAESLGLSIGTASNRQQEQQEQNTGSSSCNGNVNRNSTGTQQELAPRGQEPYKQLEAIRSKEEEEERGEKKEEDLPPHFQAFNTWNQIEPVPEPKQPTTSDPILEAICEVTVASSRKMTDTSRQKLLDVVDRLRDCGHTAEQIRQGFGLQGNNYWYSASFGRRNNQLPSAGNILNEIDRSISWKPRPKHTPNGHPSQYPPSITAADSFDEVFA
ncbi:MAG: hypothetical protein ACPG8W_01660 [Candidatus Promineifilaceae bacterium]